MTNAHAGEAHKKPKKCHACGTELPPGESGQMRVTNHNSGFRGWFCSRTVCQDEGWKKAAEEGGE
jgi:hypothetical protein